MSGHIDIGIRPYRSRPILVFPSLQAWGCNASEVEPLSVSFARQRHWPLALRWWCRLKLQHPDYLAYFQCLRQTSLKLVLVDSIEIRGKDLKLLSIRSLISCTLDHVSLGVLDGTTCNRYRER